MQSFAIDDDLWRQDCYHFMQILEFFLMDEFNLKLALNCTAEETFQTSAFWDGSFVDFLRSVWKSGN